ncbi:hypothetical protein [uncultured Tateyamaria sp.]|uniref:hypothetical protein n=1 Tax=uncultured Tateyamaria sp. TaxID=455651 RepID=UPI00260D4EEF|nr:hypothetical protein [uncultured Tateyamaria sp.]
MKHMKEVMTGAGTLAIAVGIGFVMQSSEAAQERYGAQARPTLAKTANDAKVVLNTATSADILLQVQDIELTSASEVTDVSVPETDAAVQRASATVDDLLPEPEKFPLVPECEISAEAVPVDGAMVALTLDAPCAPNERLTVHHNGMLFTHATDDAGTASITVPALAEQAVFIMAFANGDGAVAQATVADITSYDRIVLQWRGDAGFELHAREFGAEYGQPGHLWSGSDANIEGFASGANGLITRLGDTMSAQPLMAEVYTFPSALSAQPGEIDMSVEAEVTASNCGLEIEAQSLEMSQGGTLKTHNLTLAVPDCDALGSFLVLNNLVSDLKVASN